MHYHSKPQLIFGIIIKPPQLRGVLLWALRDLNPGPTDYESYVDSTISRYEIALSYINVSPISVSPTALLALFSICFARLGKSSNLRCSENRV